jgi:hypothetical protein
MEPKITSVGGKGGLVRLGSVLREGSPLPSNECGVVIAVCMCTSNANPSADINVA